MQKHDIVYIKLFTQALVEYRSSQLGANGALGTYRDGRSLLVPAHRIPAPFDRAPYEGRTVAEILAIRPFLEKLGHDRESATTTLLTRLSQCKNRMLRCVVHRIFVQNDCP